MCYPVTCPGCGKTTWGGCGAHVDGVMKTVPESQKCTCEDNPAPPREIRILQHTLRPLTAPPTHPAGRPLPPRLPATAHSRMPSTRPGLVDGAGI